MTADHRHPGRHFGRSRLGRKIVSSIPPAAAALRMVFEGDFKLDKPPRRADHPSYYVGYWQDQPYSPAELSTARAELRFLPGLTQAIEAASRLLNPADPFAAALHVRRGDYLRSGPRGPFYTLPATYYLRAMERRRRDHGVRRFVVFSDDIAWCRDNLASAGHDIAFVDPAISPSAATDFALFTAFTNKILSNSTFAWWAALLGDGEPGLITAPSPWLNRNYAGDRGKHPPALKGWSVLSTDPTDAQCELSR